MPFHFGKVCLYTVLCVRVAAIAVGRDSRGPKRLLRNCPGRPPQSSSWPLKAVLDRTLLLWKLFYDGSSQQIAAGKQ
eukprot:scaffold586536_cov13-Prasinocladus_malaysianus.AAC.1